MTTQMHPTDRDTILTATAAASVAGVGYSEQADSFAAGVEAATGAMAALGGRECTLAFLCATSAHEPTALLQGVRSVVGPRARLTGGSAVGTITNDRLGYEGMQVGVAALASPATRVELFLERGLDVRGELAVGEALGRAISRTSYVGDPNLVLMYDMIKKPQVELNVATHLLSGMSRHIDPWPGMAGVGVFGSMQLTHAATQWFDDEVLTQTAIGLVLHGGVRMHTVIMHGCRPVGRYFRITKTDGTALLEIEGQPALEYISALMPDKQWEEYPLFITIGVNRGDKFADFREEDYSNHLCMSIDRERGALIMFEPTLAAGQDVQLMRRSIDFSYVGRRVESLFAEVGDRRPFFALYIDCAGRASAFCGSDGEEATAVQDAMNARGIPLLGMYSGVEIAKFNGHPQSLDWTGVLCLFTESASQSARSSS